MAGTLLLLLGVVSRPSAYPELPPQRNSITVITHQMSSYARFKRLGRKFDAYNRLKLKHINTTFKRTLALVLRFPYLNASLPLPTLPILLLIATLQVAGCTTIKSLITAVPFINASVWSAEQLPTTSQMLHSGAGGGGSMFLIPKLDKGPVEL